MDVKKTLERLKIKYNDLNLYEEAFTHKSYLNENNDMKNSNERLEYLGDAVLSVVVADYLYAKTKMDEGKMSKCRSLIVCEASLSKIAKNLRLNDSIRLGNGQDPLRPALLEDILEALIAAIYLDKGLEYARKFILKIFKPTIKKAIKCDGNSDYKSHLQEMIKGRYPIVYSVISEEGEPHERIYMVSLTINDIELAVAKGSSKKKAEKRAAKKAIKIIEKNNNMFK